jgi:hypothetical protein
LLHAYPYLLHNRELRSFIKCFQTEGVFQLLDEIIIIIIIIAIIAIIATKAGKGGEKPVSDYGLTNIRLLPLYDLKGKLPKISGEKMYKR